MAAVLIATVTIAWLIVQYFSPPMDLIIEGGQIIDGKGNEPRRADIGICGGRICAIGFLQAQPARQRINAQGLFIAPGFIDVHTHIEPNIPTNAPVYALNFVRQGVTTVITGNCGSSRVPLDSLFEREHNGWQINIGSLVGHNDVRKKVMGEAQRVASGAELEHMREIVTEAMRNGALGFSTGLAYTPGNAANPHELLVLAGVAARYGGVYATHIRDEANNGDDAVREAIEIGRTAGLPVEISHFKMSGQAQWGLAEKRLALVTSARQRGEQVFIDLYPYTYSSTQLDLVFPPKWLEPGVMRRVSRNPQLRKKLAAEILDRAKINGWRDLSFATVAFFGHDHTLDGLTINQVCSRRSGQDCTPEEQADTAIDLRLHGGAQMLYHDMEQRDVDTIAGFEDGMIGSDGSVRYANELGRRHPRAWTTFPTFLARYVRGQGIRSDSIVGFPTISWGEAARRMSGLPAEFFGLSDRGTIELGKWADLTVFDPATIGVEAIVGEEDISQSVTGIMDVLVNGKAVILNGIETHELPGVAIRRQRALGWPTLARTNSLSAKPMETPHYLAEHANSNGQ